MGIIEKEKIFRKISFDFWQSDLLNKEYFVDKKHSQYL